MSVPTLHRLLWGARPDDGPLSAWRPRPWEVPAVGLPSRVAAFLFCSVQQQRVFPQSDWTPSDGPLVWQISDGDGTLASGRRLQFGYEESNQADGMQTDQRRKITVSRTRSWEIPPHGAFFLPFVSGNESVHSRAYLLFCDVLLLISALDGGEAVLDGLATGGSGNVPFEDRWDWRARLHLPDAAWNAIEDVVCWSADPSKDLSAAVALNASMARLAPETVHLADFTNERVDINLSPEPEHGLEAIRTVHPKSNPDHTSPPNSLCVDRDQLTERITVRIGQISHWPPRVSVRGQFPSFGLSVSQRIMAQVEGAFRSRSHSGSSDNKSLALVILPEVTIPEWEIRTVRDLVKDTGRASLAGLYWRVLPPVYLASAFTTVTRWWFVNEAELIVPLGFDDRGPVSVRWFRIRKPLPTHREIGLARALSKTGPKWNVLRGLRIYRFVHPKWGDFSIAICADLIESSFWRSLRGEILHLFMVAFNRDVELYEALTRVRSYEEYVNMLGVNHGRYGGSLAWTPKSGHDKEIARVRGGNLFVLADVELPVRDLYDAQRDGVQKAEREAEAEWKSRGTRSRREPFKAPPPGFVRRGDDVDK